MIVLAVCGCALLCALAFEFGLWLLTKAVELEVPRGELASMYWAIVVVVTIFATTDSLGEEAIVEGGLPACFVIGAHCYLTDKYRARSHRYARRERAYPPTQPPGEYHPRGKPPSSVSTVRKHVPPRGANPRKH